MCVFVPPRKTCFLVDWRLLVNKCIANISTPIYVFGFLFVLMIFTVFNHFHMFDLCIMGEFVRGGFVAVAVSVTDK